MSTAYTRVHPHPQHQLPPPPVAAASIQIDYNTSPRTAACHPRREPQRYDLALTLRALRRHPSEASPLNGASTSYSATASTHTTRTRTPIRFGARRRSRARARQYFRRRRATRGATTGRSPAPRTCSTTRAARAGGGGTACGRGRAAVGRARTRDPCRATISNHTTTSPCTRIASWTSREGGRGRLLWPVVVKAREGHKCGGGVGIGPGDWIGRERAVGG